MTWNQHFWFNKSIQLIFHNFLSLFIMADGRHGLRPRVPKETEKPPAKTNAEKCRDYRIRLQVEDPAKDEERKEKNRANSKKWRDNLTPEEKERQKALATERQQKRRQKLKELKENNPRPTPKKKSTSTPTRATAKLQEEKANHKREQDRIRQAKRRDEIRANPQKHRREKEKRRKNYHDKKSFKVQLFGMGKKTGKENKDKRGGGKDSKKRKKIKNKGRFFKVVNDVKSGLKKCRSKAALIKLQFLKNILAKEDVNQTRPYYIRKKIRSDILQIPIYLNKVSVDIPYMKSGQKAKKVLTKNMLDLFLDFKDQHPDSKVSFSTFKRKRPNNILLSNSIKFVQCLCEKCVNIMLVMEPLNFFLEKKPETGQPAMNSKISNAEELVKKTMCKDVKRECIDRKCEFCGVSGLVETIKKAVGKRMETEVEWKRWEKTDESSKDLVIKTDSVGQVICVLEKDLFSLGKHIHTAQWQRKHYQFLRDNLVAGHCLITADFAENYLCKFQNEVQSAHWSYRQVTLHPCVFFYRCCQPGCKKVITHYSIFLSDDIKHDSFFTRLVFDKVCSFAESKGFFLLQIFSDGCSSQYKSRLPFLHLTQLQADHPKVRLRRHYFGAGHGKSLCDSAGGTIKNCASRAVASGKASIQSAQDLYNFCLRDLSISLSGHCADDHIVRTFELIKTDEVKRDGISVEDLKCVKGTQSIHCVVPSGSEGSLGVRLLSCTCPVCLVGEEGECENKSITLDWKGVSVLKGSFGGTSSKNKLVRFSSKSKGTSKSKSTPKISASNIDSVPSSPQYPIPLEDDIPMDDRDSFFTHLYAELSVCDCLEAMQALTLKFKPLLENFPLPQVTTKTVVEVNGCIDKVAQALMPEGFGCGVLYPVLIKSDGNCVPRALSLAVFGTEDSHLEVRCRIVLELSQHVQEYVNSLDDSSTQVLCETSNHFFDSVYDTFIHELLDVKSLGTFMGVWQLMAAANVFGAKITSVYPQKGIPCHRRLFNRVLEPRVERSSSSIIILWSSSRDLPDSYWTANHVVLMLPICHTVTVEVE